jgi:uncharacterized membrane protein YjjP (DUF1212 family)
VRFWTLPFARLAKRRETDERGATSTLDGLVASAPRPRGQRAETVRSLETGEVEALDPALVFMLRLSRALLGWGLPAQRIEESLERLAEALGLDVDVLSTPTGLVVSLTDGTTTRTRVVRMEPGGSDLERLSALHDLVGRVERKEITPEDADQRLRAILARPASYEGAPRLAGFALVSAMSAVLLGGGGLDVPLAAVLGTLVGVIELLGRKVHAVERLLPALASTAVSLGASALAAAHLDVRPSVLLLASIVVLLPGLTVTTAIIELATVHLVSGTSRLMGGIVTFLQLGFGIALGQKLGELLPDVVTPHEAPFPAWWLELLAPVGFAIGLGILLKARRRDAPVMLGAVAVAAIGGRLGGWLLGAELGAFVGAMLVTAAAHTYARLRDRPTAIVLVPGTLFLVPGSVGFLSVQSMLENEVENATATGFRMLLVATAIAAGTLVATAAVPPRRAL